MSNNYVSDTKIEVAAAAPADSTEAAPTQETASVGTSSGLPAGVLDLTTIPREQWVDRGDWIGTITQHKMNQRKTGAVIAPVIVFFVTKIT
ncbi:MAG: hypothetical protein J1F42_05805 [Lachnospiraceae bacterium]|nr:hypothetical protein [Lachnospiraceae bacterium]